MLASQNDLQQCGIHTHLGWGDKVKCSMSRLLAGTRLGISMSMSKYPRVDTDVSGYVVEM